MPTWPARHHDQQVGFVFPGSGRTGYLIEPKRQIAHVRRICGIHFTIHDLRRTFATVAESLDVPYYAMKRLLNHRTQGDVTAGYIQISVERLRQPMQRISEFLLQGSDDAVQASLRSVSR